MKMRRTLGKIFKDEDLFWEIYGVIAWAFLGLAMGILAFVIGLKL